MMGNGDKYILDYRHEEQERLQRQAQQLAHESRWLFDHIGVVCLASHRLLAGVSPVVVSARAPRRRLPVLLGDRGC